MIKINSIRGMHDIYGLEYQKHEKIILEFSNLLAAFNYKPISTPIIEHSEVFSRTLGKDSDVVNKEMYTFKDNSNDTLTLRPEGTASIARAVISNGLTQNIPLKFYYHGPMFRYERPQKGRFRQFHQLGVELYGNSGVYQDCEAILTAYKFLNKINVIKNLDLRINTLGSISSRKKYMSALHNYFELNKNNLSSQSKKRLQVNPLRILDSKEKEDIELFKEAPLIYNYLNEEELNYFNKLKKLLIDLKIEFIQDPFLVRGLDYYNHTTFEFTIKNNSKFAVLAGGKYDNLVKELGGPAIEGVGWASGIERLAEFLKINKPIDKLVAIIPLNQDYYTYGYKLAEILLNIEVKTELLNSFNLKKSLKYCNKINASHAIIFGEDEINNSRLSIKNLVDGNQMTVNNDALKEYFINE